MQRNSYREFLIWQQWYKDEMNKPSRSDYYVMQVAASVIRGYAKDASSVHLKNMELEFSFESDHAKPKMTKEQAAEMSKARWFAFAGKGGKIRGLNAPAPADEPKEPKPKAKLPQGIPLTPKRTRRNVARSERDGSSPDGGRDQLPEDAGLG